MTDKSFFLIPESGDEYPKLVFQSKPQFMVDAVDLKMKGKVGLIVESEFEGAVVLTSQAGWENREDLAAANRVLITNLGDLNLHRKSSRATPRAELDERATVFAKALLEKKNLIGNCATGSWYHTLVGNTVEDAKASGSREFELFNLSPAETHSIKIKSLNHAEYSVASFEAAERTAEEECRSDVSDILKLSLGENGGRTDGYVIFVHSGDRTRLVYFLQCLPGRASDPVTSFLRCYCVRDLRPNTLKKLGPLAFMKNRAPQREISGYIVK